jgi:hypothetical protein
MRHERTISTYSFVLIASIASLPLLGGAVPAGATIRAEAPIASSGSYMPLANGDVFNYAATSRSTLTENGKTTHTTQKSTQVETVTYPVKHGGKNGLYALTSTSTYASGPSATGTDFVRLEKQGPLQLEEVLADTSSETEGSVSITGTQTFKSPLIIDELPEAQGLSWSEAAAFVYSFEYGGPSFTITEAIDQDASGGYTEQYKEVFGSNTITSNYVLKDNGTGTLTNDPGGRYAFGLPVKQGGSYVIPVVYQSATTDVPDWYPGGAAPLQPLDSQPTAIGALVKTPKTCGSKANMSAYDVRAEQTELDPIAGDYLTDTSDEYDVAGMGTVCAISVSSVKGYDNLSTGKLTLTSTSTFTEILTSEIVKASTRFGIAEPFSSLPTRAWAPRVLDRAGATQR